MKTRHFFKPRALPGMGQQSLVKKMFSLQFASFGAPAAVYAGEPP